jgi:hypothetical protein
MLGIFDDIYFKMQASTKAFLYIVSLLIIIGSPVSEEYVDVHATLLN